MNGLDNKYTPGTDEVHLLQYLVVLAKHSRMIVFTTMAVTVLTFLILYISPNRYTAKARLMPPQQNMTLSGQILDTLAVGSSSLTGGNLGGMGSTAMSLLGLKSPGDIYVGILKGDTIFDRIIQQFDFRNRYKSFLSSGPPYIEDLRNKLGKMVDINSGKDGLITIEVTAEDPKLASDMTNAFAKELDELLRQVSRKDAENQLIFLEGQRAQAGVALAKAEDATRTFSEKTNVLQIDAQTKGMLEYIANLRATIDAKEVEAKVLSKQATPANFDLIRLETEVRGLKEKLRAAETKLDPNCVGDVCLPTSKVPELGLEYLRLFRETKYRDQVYQLYCKLAEMARLDAARNVATVLFVDQAIPPEKRSRPKRLLMTLVIGFVTFCGMVLWSFFLEFWQRASTQEDQVKHLQELHGYLQPWREISGRFLAKLGWRR